MTAGDPDLQDLQAVVLAHLPHATGVSGVTRLTGGASQELWRVDVTTSTGNVRLALRRVDPSADVGVGEAQRLHLSTEAMLIRRAAAVDVPVPDIVHVCNEATDGLGEGYLMSWVDGETLGGRIAKSSGFEAVRPSLAFQCGELLARIHSIEVDPEITSRLQTFTADELIHRTWDRYRAYAVQQPMIDYAARWLLDHSALSSPVLPRLVHGDFRNGNLAVSPTDGVVGVLDWELAHLGDPMRDLGWLCTNSWRFGNRDLPVGGFGIRADLFAGYESVSGVRVDPDRVKFWEVFGSFWWSIGCLTMADRWRQGGETSPERLVIGRRSSECQLDLVLDTIPTPVQPEVAAEPTTESSNDMPSADELLAGAAGFLLADIASDEGLGDRSRFLARVAARSLDIVRRELAIGPATREREHARLSALLQRTGSLHELRVLLVGGLRDGSIDISNPQLADHLRATVVDQVRIDQPSYAAQANL
ncbi:MAG TPA: phosphotransferase family protein [Ilumatobacter sp.]|nr:phosphotransferase family protein [Ilumatobacter sp.]